MIKHDRSFNADMDPHYGWYDDGYICQCLMFRAEYYFCLKDCPNCKGFGIMPIPWGELKNEQD